MNAACSSPSLSADSVLPGLIDEITERLNRGELVDVDAYVARHPDLAAPLRQVFQTLSMLREPLPASAGVGKPASDELVPRRLGDFRIVREIGRGGMGIVYEAEQISLGRKVALKVLPLAGLLDKRQLSRFRNEARAAATLHHPHIVPVYAVGEDRGMHFYAMQHIEGKSLAEVILECGDPPPPALSTDGDCKQGSPPGHAVLHSHHRETPSPASASVPGTAFTDKPNGEPSLHSKETRPAAALSTAYSTRRSEYFRSVARLGAEVADALHYAHEMGVVHRDVKPSNLLLDGDGQVWVADFGLASVDGNSPGLTMSGDLVGTLRYMSPEQAGGRRELTDHRTDVYSLGVTLYELVTLRPAYAEEDRGRLLQQILYTGPRLPRHVDRHIPRDLETIILKSIDKQRSARYETGGELADDLRRFLAQQPVQARRASRVRRTWQWARRNRVVAALGALAACLLLTFAIVGPIVAVRERRLNSELELQQYVSSIGLAASELQLGRTQRAFDILSRYQDSDLCGFELHLLLAQSARHRTAIELRPGPPAWKTAGTIRDVAYSPEGSLVAAAHWSNNVKVWDVNRGTVVHPLKMPGKPRAVAFSSDGAFVAAGSELAQLHIWDVRDGSLLQTEDLHPFVPTSGGSPWRAVHGVAFAPDRASVAVVVGQGDSTTIEPPDVGGALVIWGRGAKTPTEPFKLELHVPLANAASAVAFDSDGSRVFVGCSDGGVICFSAADGSVLFRTAAHDLPLRSLALSPDGALLATASCDQTIKLFRSRDGSHVRTLFGHTKDVHDVAFSPDGRHIASASFDSSIRLWDADTGEQIAALWGHASPAWCVAFAPDGRTCASGAVEGAVRIWDVAQACQQRPEIVQLDAGAWGLAFSPNGRLVATCSESGQVWIGDAATAETKAVLPSSELGGNSLAFSPDGQMIVRGGGSWEFGLKRPTASEPFPTQGELTVWEVGTGAEVARRSAHGAAIRAVLVCDDGQRAVSVGLDGSVKSWDFPALRQSDDIRLPDSPIFSAALSPDGRLLVLGTENGVELWRLENGSWRKWLTRIEHADWVPGIAFSPDGRLFASSSTDGTAIIWSARRGEPLRRITGHQSWVLAVAFSRDGKTLAAASQHDIKLYNVETGSELLTLHGHTNWIEAAAFSPVEDLLVSTSADDTARFWRTR